jgi:hypothetical protein
LDFFLTGAVDEETDVNVNVKVGAEEGRTGAEM